MTKKTFTGTVSVAVAAVVLVAIGFYFAYPHRAIGPSLGNEKNPTASSEGGMKAGLEDGQASADVANDNCHISSDYVVVSKQIPDSVGSDILVKYRNANSGVPGDMSGSLNVGACDYAARSGDFEIKNQNVEYFDKLVGRYLVLDSGTGPDIRGIIVYDLNKKSKVYEGLKAGGKVAVSGATLTYWEPQQQVAVTAANCPKLGEYEKLGMGAGIQAKVTLTLGDDSMVQKEAGETECVMRQ